MKVVLVDVEIHDNTIPLESYTMRQGKVCAVVCHPGKPIITVIKLKGYDNWPSHNWPSHTCHENRSAADLRVFCKKANKRKFLSAWSIIYILKKNRIDKKNEFYHIFT